MSEHSQVKVLFRRSAALTVASALILAHSAALPVAAQQRERPFGLDSLVDSDPVLAYGAERYVVPVELIQLWRTALERDETGLRRRTAEAIADLRITAGGTDDEELREQAKILIEPLRKIASSTAEDRKVLLAVARALCTLGDRESADTLLKLSERLGPDAAEIVEPHLARWKHEPAIAAWQERLNDDFTSTRSRILALRGLRDVNDTSSADPALELATDPRGAVSLRFEAARAAAALKTEGLEARAEQYLQPNATLMDQLVGVQLLSRHQGDRAVELLTKYALLPAPAVQRIAIERLQQMAPQVVIDQFDILMQSPDAKVRELTVTTMRAFPTESHVGKVSPSLADRHPDVREAGREVLVHYYREHELLRDAVTSEIMGHLTGDDWKGMQQAARFVGQVDYEPAALDCLPLLEHPRATVHTTAAWALRKLEVEETLPHVYRHTVNISHAILANAPSGEPSFKPENPFSNDEDVAQLMVLMGRLGYTEADELMRRYVPKDVSTIIARRGAIAGLSYLHKDNAPQDGLVNAMVARIRDTESSMPEAEVVRASCAVALGRMKARSALDTLREYKESDSVATETGYACAWAILQITGETFEPAGPRDLFLRPPFLLPISRPDGQ